MIFDVENEVFEIVGWNMMFNFGGVMDRLDLLVSFFGLGELLLNGMEFVVE